MFTYIIYIGELYRYYDAIADCNDALDRFRGNLLIDYKQLGMQHKLYACEVSKPVNILQDLSNLKFTGALQFIVCVYAAW